MSYQLNPGETFKQGAKRIASEQADKALASLTEQTDKDEAIHDARKRFKKIRAVLRLVRDEVGDETYKCENKSYRDAGRQISAVRDSTVYIKTLDNLKERYSEPLDTAAFTEIRSKLVAQHEQLKQQALADTEKLAEVVETIELAQRRIEEWPIDRTGFAVVRPGLKRVYKRGRKAMAKAYKSPSPENFHEWRKRVKYLWYHFRILQPLWSGPLGAWAEALHQLADYLGDAHDLANLAHLLQEQPVADEREQQALLGLINQRHAELVAAARPLGERIYHEEPALFVQRLENYWQIWRHEVEKRS